MSVSDRLDPASHEPFYLQVAARLRAALESGRYAAGQRLPSEKELSDRYGVSRSTAIAALDELVRSHLAHRVRGRGTFAARPILSRFSLATSFSEDVRGRGLEPSTRVLGLARSAPPDPDVVARL